ncbi:MAG: hypothetical protein AAB823_02275, partial [Patescibacteria group bacterium]
HLLLNSSAISPNASDVQQQELFIVANRLDLNLGRLNNLIKDRFRIIKIKVFSPEIKERFLKYVLDPNDAHIVAGIATAKPSFFVSYNLRHFEIDKIKTDFKAISLTPAQLLQYLRLRRDIA